MALKHEDWGLACKGIEIFLRGRFGLEFKVDMERDFMTFQIITRILVVNGNKATYVTERWDDIDMVERQWFEYQPREETLATIMLLTGT